VLENLFLTLLIRLLAQTNSVARIPRATGMTTKAGPGKTIIASPMASMVKPITVTTNLLTRFRFLDKKGVNIPSRCFRIGFVFQKKDLYRDAFSIVIKVWLIRISPTNGTGLLKADVLTITAIKATPLYYMGEFNLFAQSCQEESGKPNESRGFFLKVNKTFPVSGGGHKMTSRVHQGSVFFSCCLNQD
jgi:hypothetical protein